MDEIVSFLYNNLQTLLNIHAPYRISRITKTRAPWLSRGIKDMIKLRNKTFARFKRSGRHEHWNYYKQI